MSEVFTFLAPYSHWVLSHRNTIIVVLGIVLFLVACHSLIKRWQVERLERDLTDARGGIQRSAPGRVTYGRGQPASAMPQTPDPAGLPPVKGGRTYARNLGSALQKAGMASGPAIYSPPTPPGWAPAGQPPGLPQQAPGYQPAGSWGSPPVQPAPWGFGPTAGQGRPGVPPAFVPPPPQTFRPQGTPPQAPVGQPSGPFGPTSPAITPPFYMPPPSTQAAPAQEPGPASPSLTPTLSSGLMAPPSPAELPQLSPMVPSMQPEPPHPEPVPETGRRGKGKRRRFNLSVLENFERMVKPAPPEPEPTISQAAAPMVVVPPPASTPSFVTPSPAFVPPAAGVSPAAAAPATAPDAISEPQEAAVTPAAEESTPAPAEAESLAEAVPPGPPRPEPEATISRDARASMRAMLFGEEPPPPRAEEPAEAREAAGPSIVEEPTLGFLDESAPVAPGPMITEEPAASPPEEQAIPVEDTVEPESAALAEASVETPATEPVELSSDGSGDATAPVAAAPVVDEPAAGQPSQGESSDHAGATLVIIEDDPKVALYYATLFRGNGYRVEVAHDGVSGVDLCSKVRPAVILLDVMMPRQNGILVLQTLRASDETRDTPVVVLSNFSEPTLIKRALQLGALEYVIKTQVEGPGLLQAVPRWISREKAFAA